MDISNAARGGKLSRKALMAAVVMGGAWSAAHAITAPYESNFDEVTAETVPADAAASGRVVVSAAAGLGGTQGLVLKSEEPAGRVSYAISGCEAGVYHLDLRVRAAAVSAGACFLNFDGAQLAFRDEGGGRGRFYAYDGRMGLANGSGSWVPVGGAVALDSAGMSAGFSRVTLRVDFVEHRFDVVLDGVLAVAELGMDDATVVAPARLTFLAQSKGDVILDNLSLRAARPSDLPADSDGDGMVDEWESARGLNPNDPADRRRDRDNDGVNNVIEAALSSAPGYTFVGALAGVREVPGSLLRETWLNTAGVTLPELYAATADLAKAPDRKGFTTAGDAPANCGDHYGQRLRGWVTVPRSGEYEFYVAGDDQSELRLAVDGDPGKATQIATVPTYSGYRQWTKFSSQKSAAITLVAGARVYVELRAKEGGGADHVSLGWKTPGAVAIEPVPAAVLTSYAGTAEDPNANGIPDAWEVSNGLMAVAGAVPQAGFGADDDADGDGLSNREEWARNTNPRVSDFSPAVTTTGAWLLERWEGVAGFRIPDLASGTKGFITAPAFRGLFAGTESLLDSGDNYGRRLRARLTAPAAGDYVFAVAGDDDVRLSLSADATAAKAAVIASVSGFTGRREFTKYASQVSEPVTLGAGETRFVELLTKDGGGADHFSIHYRMASEPASALRPVPVAWLSSYTPDADDADCDGLPDSWEGANGLSASDNGSTNVANGAYGDPDADGLTNAEEYRLGKNPRESDVPSGGAGSFAGALMRELWTGIAPADIAQLESLTLNYTKPVTSRTLLTGSESTLSGAGFGERLYGCITPAVTGDYRLALASDDAAQVWLSTDATRANAVKVAEVTGYTYQRVYSRQSSQVSSPIRLEAGRRYYVEVRHANVGGPAHLSLAWRTSDDREWEPVPASALTAAYASDDADADTLPDAWESANGLSPASAAGNDGPLGDPDGDGLTNIQEQKLGLNPTSADTAGDGVGDWNASVARLSASVSFRFWPGTYDSKLINTANPVEDTLLSAKLRVTVPTLRLVENASESPRNMANAYTGEITGYLIAPTTGEYTLAIASDDRGVLYLSEDESPEKLRRVAKVSSYTDYRQFTKEASQQSAKIRLEAGKRYLFRAFAVEIGGNDHLQLGWALPGDSSVVPVPAACVAPAPVWPLYTTDASRLAFTDDDGDGLNNLREQQLGTNPAVFTDVKDLNANGLPDAWEIARGWSVTPGVIETGHGANDDPDGDGLNNLREQQLGTNPAVFTDLKDLNANGLPDAWEIARGWSVTPGVIETGHGANDDPDGDGYVNAKELLYGTNPNQAENQSQPLTIDQDGIELASDFFSPDSLTAGFNYHDKNDFMADADGDGIPNGCEIAHGSDPYSGASKPAYDFVVDPNAAQISPVNESGTKVVNTFEQLRDYIAILGIQSPLVLVKNGNYGDTLAARGGVYIGEVGKTPTRLECLIATPGTWVSGFSVGNANHVRPQSISREDYESPVNAYNGGGYTGGNPTMPIVFRNLIVQGGTNGITCWNANVRVVQCSFIETGRLAYFVSNPGKAKNHVEFLNCHTQMWSPDMLPFAGENAEVGLRGTVVNSLNYEYNYDHTGHYWPSYVIKNPNGDGAVELNTANEDIYGHIYKGTPPVGAVVGIDTDKDGVPDNEEWRVGSDPGVAAGTYLRSETYDPEADYDGDGVKNRDELEVFKTGIYQFDKKSSLSVLDTDGDGLSDYDEMYRHGTDRLLSDTDGDSISDAEEISMSLNPLSRDSDGDGVTDDAELNADDDGDGLSNRDEIYRYNGDPMNADTDGDGLSDLDELQYDSTGASIRKVDSNNNGIPDAYDFNSIPYSHQSLWDQWTGITQPVNLDEVCAAYAPKLIPGVTGTHRFKTSYELGYDVTTATATLSRGRCYIVAPKTGRYKFTYWLWSRDGNVKTRLYLSTDKSPLNKEKVADFAVEAANPQLSEEWVESSRDVEVDLVEGGRYYLESWFESEGAATEAGVWLEWVPPSGVAYPATELMNNLAAWGLSGEDANDNGLYDDWERGYGWNVTAGVIEPGHGATDDPDGDGVSNLREQQEGTNPTVPNALTAGMLATYTPEQIAALTPAQLASLSAELIGGLTAAQFEALTAARLTTLSDAQLAAVTAAQVATLAPDEVTALNQKLSAAQIGALTATQIRALTAADLAALGGKLTPAQIYDLSAEQAQSLAPDALGAFTLDQLAALRPEQIAALSPEQIGAITPAQIEAMTTTQLAALTPAQIASFTPTQIGALSGQDISSLSVDQASAISATGVAGMSVEQIHHLTAEQVAAMVAANPGVFTSGQRDELGLNFTPRATTPAASGSLATLNLTVYDREVNGLVAVKSVNLAGDTVTVLRDGAGRTLQTIDGRGKTTAMSYDAAGRLLSQVDATGAGTRHTYDALGRRTASSDLAIVGKTHRQTYDVVGRLITTTDPVGVTTTYGYDLRDRRITESTPMNGSVTRVITHGYDRDGLSVSLTDANGAVTRWAYDTAGRQVSKTYANGDTLAMAYDEAGRLHTLTDGNGTITASEYDFLGRLTVKTYTPVTGPADTDTYRYDEAGRLVSVTKGRYAHTLTYAYDQAGRPASETHPDGEVVVTDYDAAGRLAHLDVNRLATRLAFDRYEVSYAYDARGQLAGVSSGDYASRYERRDNGQLASVINYRATNPQADILRLDRSYDAGARLVEVANTAASGEQVGVRYTLGADDQRIEALEETGQQWSYGYDGLKQLVRAQKTDTASAVVSPLDQSYAYDPMGNRTAYAEQGKSLAYAANNANQYTGITETSSGTPQALTYDRNGNLLTDGRRTYTWDVENQLVAVTPVNPAEGSQRVEYTYDWKMRRTGKRSYTFRLPAGWTLSATTAFKYSGWNPIEETTLKAGTETPEVKRYVWGEDLSGSQQGAGGVGGLLGMSHLKPTSTSVENYFHAYDGNGNVRALVKADPVTPTASAIVEKYAYDAFGRELEGNTPAATSVNTFRFSTKALEAETGMNYYGYRFYAADSGRWINRDPILEQGGLNVYAMLGNNPTLTFDVDGCARGDYWDPRTYAPGNWTGAFTNPVYRPNSIADQYAKNVTNMATGFNSMIYSLLNTPADITKAAANGIGATAAFAVDGNVREYALTSAQVELSNMGCKSYWQGQWNGFAGSFTNMTTDQFFRGYGQGVGILASGPAGEFAATRAAQSLAKVDSAIAGFADSMTSVNVPAGLYRDAQIKIDQRLVFADEGNGLYSVTSGYDKNAFIEARLTNGDLRINAIYVPEYMQGNGISKAMYKELTSKVPSFNSISGEMIGTNWDSLKQAVSSGLSLEEAAALTPAARARESIGMGLTKHTYDASTNVLTSTRNLPTN